MSLLSVYSLVTFAYILFVTLVRTSRILIKAFKAYVAKRRAKKLAKKLEKERKEEAEEEKKRKQLKDRE